MPEKEIQAKQKEDSGIHIEGGGGFSSCAEQMENDTDTSDVPTILGNQLQGNPYSVAVMQQASINLYGHANGVTVNKLYVRFKPANLTQVLTLQSVDIELFDYPLDYELLHEGDYYPQAGVGQNDIPWYYSVVDAGFQPPAGIQYEIIQQVYIPDTDLWLEQEAFRITGNPFEDSCGTVANRVPPPCEIDPCAPGCPLDGCGDGGGGGNPPPDIKRPAGNLTVWDNRLDNGRNVVVRRIKVVARNFLKTERVYTDNSGRFLFTKRFNKVTLLVKMENNNTAVRGLFGVRLWNLVWSLKKNIGKYKGNLGNIQYTFFRQELVRSRGMQDWVGVTAFNKRMDFNGLAFQDGIPGTPVFLNLFVTAYAGAASAPMFPHRYPNNNELLNVFVPRHMGIVLMYPELTLLVTEIAKATVDVLYGYNRALENLDSDDISEVMFHELSHAQHYNKAGNDWWHEFVLSELTETADNAGTQFDPYGQGNTVRSPIIALGESWAYHYGRVLADRVYAGFSSAQFEQGFEYRNGSIWQSGFLVAITGLNAHVNLLEDFDPNRNFDPFFWIPQGIYNDMFDNRNDIQFNRVFLDDQVVNYTNDQFFNALDNDITTLQQYRQRLLLENGNNQAAGVNTIFQFYGY